MGGAGVVLAALATHQADPARLGPASSMLLFHACAVLGCAALTERDLLQRHLGLVTLSGFVLGDVLFATDLTVRHFSGHSLFPMAAPTGGMILIAGWLALGLAALTAGSRDIERGMEKGRLD
jgi:uncharacterized membrane protein YgdD (TMEM256/DUF423 family)